MLNSGSDAIIQSATGSGKTLSFVMPLLGSALRYPPEANPAEFPVRLSTRQSLICRVHAMIGSLKLSRPTVQASLSSQEVTLEMHTSRVPNLW